jgi:hypothetical protein
MKSNQFTRDFLLMLFGLYYGLNLLYIDGSILSQICLVTIILISVVYLIKTLLSNYHKSLFFKAWTFMIVLNIIGFICNPDFSEGLSRDMFKAILVCMLPFYPFLYFTRKGLLTSNHLIIFMLVIIPIFILQFFKLESSILAERAYSEMNVVNNVSYSFVSLIPFVFLIKRNRFYSSMLMILLFIFIIQGSKRGAILTGSIGLLLYFYFQMSIIEDKKRIRSYLLAILALGGLSVITYNYLMSNDFLIYRMTSMFSGDSSGRDYLYLTLFNKWYYSYNLFNLIFGFGFAASVTLAGDYAHNDWLELLSNFGITGICTYLFLFYAAIKYCLDKALTIDKRLLMITITLMWFFTTLISMSYTSQGGFLQAILLGYLIAEKEKIPE